MKTDYTNYRAEQLLEDDFFVSSMLHQTEDTKLFWEIQIANNIVDEEEIMIALRFLQAMQVKEQKMSFSDSSQIWERIESTNKSVNSYKRKVVYKLFIAASLILLMTVSSLFYFFESDNRNDTLFMIAQSSKPDSEISDVQLVLANNRSISINKQEIDIQYDEDGNVHINDEKIARESYVVATEKERPFYDVINQLIVPKGKRSTLTFSDGTIIWVNSGSRVIYPELFEIDQREIYVDGEVYLQVAPDKERPFIVKTKKTDIKVLGTIFNVSAYEEEDTQTIALVEGSVEVIVNRKKAAVLTPNELFQYKDRQINIKKTNLTQYISWVEGWYIFDREQLSVILDKLSRYYGKNIEYHEDMGSIRCSGKLDLKDNFDEVLNAVLNATSVHYTKKGDVYLLF